MNSGINLLAQKEDVGAKEKKRIKYLRIVAGILLGIVAITIILLIIFYSQLKISSIKKEQDSAIKNISHLREKSAKLTAINDRIKNITQILKTRKDHQDLIDTILEQMSEKIKVKGIDISEEEIYIRLSSTSLYDIKVFTDKMIALARKKEVIKDLRIESFVVNVKNDEYNLLINSNLP